MARARFAIAVEDEELRTTLSEVIAFDLKSADDADTAALASQRVAAFNHAPLLLGVTHLMSGLVLLSSLYAKPFSQLLPLLAWLVVILLLDAGMLMLLSRRSKLGFQSHTIVRLMCCYVALSGVLGTLLAGTAADIGRAEVQGDLPLVIASNLTAIAIVAVTSPPVAIVGAAVEVAQIQFFSPGPLTFIALLLLSAGFVSYSLFGSRAMLTKAWQRLQLDQSARKALQFVGEFENSGRGWFWETNAQGTLSYVSQQLADDFNCHPQQLLGRQFTDLLFVDRVAELDSLREERTLGFHLSARFPFSDVIVRAASDDDIWWSLSGNPIFDDLGRFLGFRGIGTDLTEQRRSEQEISRLARFDSLTGLPNRAAMRQTLDEAIRNSASRKKGCALFLIDLDRFKNVNDTLGHPVGDALLRQVAERLNSVMGDRGQIGRLGGDEFKAVLPGIVEVGLLEEIARKIIDQVSAPYLVEGHRVTIGASVGIAIADVGRGSADSLIRNADLALYAAKEAGRGKHCFFEPSMHSEASDRQLLENDLRQAIERAELRLVYQPIVAAVSEELTGFEALVRWTHPTRGEVSPAKFIPIAEECGLVGKIGEWVLRTAIAEASTWAKGVRVAVNLSPVQFNDSGIVALIGNLLKESQLDPACLELEITEGVFLDDSDRTEVTFARLKKLGVRLALDDFGTGYSSLGYLKKAPFDKIKIDQSFVRGASSPSNRNSAIIRAIVTLAESLGMDSCAEGVETHDDLELIRQLGCNQVQGFIFGRAVEAEDARAATARKQMAAEGFKANRSPRHRLMRRGVMGMHGRAVAVRLRDISVTGALVECEVPMTPGTDVVIDIVGCGPVRATVQWAHSNRFGVMFETEFDLRRLAPREATGGGPVMLTPDYLDEHKRMFGG